MGASRTLALLITGNASGAKNALNETGAAAKRTGSDTAAASRVIGTAMLAAGAAVVAFAVKSAQTYERVGIEVLRVSRAFGSTAEEASALRFAAQMSGIDVDKLTTGLGRLSKTIVGTPEKLADIGIAAMDASGQIRPMTQILPELADKFAAMPNGIEKNALALSLFGRAGTEMIPLLNKGSEGMAELTAKAEKMGLILDGPAVQAAINSRMAHRELSAAMESLQLQVGQHVVPVITDLIGRLSDLAPVIGDLLASPITLTAGALLLMAGAAQKVWMIVGPIAGPIWGATAATQAWAASMIAAEVASAGLLAVTAALAVAVAAPIAVGVAAIKASDNAKNAANDARESIIAAGRTDTWEGLQQRIADTQASYNALYNDWNPLVRKNAGEIADAANALTEYANRAIDLGNAVGISKEEALQWLNAQSALGIEFPSTAAAVAEYTGVVDKSTMSTEEAAAAIESQQEKLKSLNDSLQALIDPFFAMESALNANVEAQAKATAAGVELYLAQLNLDAVMADATSSDAERAAALENVAQKQRDLDAANMAAAKSALDVTTAANNLSYAMDVQGLTVADAQAQLDLWVKQGLLTEEQARQVAEKMGWVADKAGELNGRNVTLTVSANGLAYTVQNFLNLANAIRDVNQEARLLSPGISGGGPSVLYISGQAQGGPLEPWGVYQLHDTPYPEVARIGDTTLLFTGSQGGEVTNLGLNPMPSPDLAPASFVPATSGGGDTYVTVNMPPGSDGEDVVNALKRYERRNGNGWRS